MNLQLRNDKNPNRTLTISKGAFFKILELAEDYGWYPMGTALPGEWMGPELELGEYDPCHQNGMGRGNGDAGARLVMLEDALNLADALERAFLEYDPERQRAVSEITMAGRVRPIGMPGPGIGSIAALIDFCRQGAYWIDGGC